MELPNGLGLDPGAGGSRRFTRRGFGGLDQEFDLAPSAADRLADQGRLHNEHPSARRAGADVLAVLAGGDGHRKGLLALRGQPRFAGGRQGHARRISWNVEDLPTTPATNLLAEHRRGQMKKTVAVRAGEDLRRTV